MTLALLLTAVTGAWAQTETLLTTITPTGKGSYSETTAGVVTVTLSNVRRYNGDFGWLWGGSGSVTVEAKEGYTITRCVFKQNAKTPVTITTSPFAITFDDRGDCVQNDDMDGVTSIEVYGPAAPAEPAIDVTTNAAEEGATFTEASFLMPTYDVNFSYELVRDMSINMTTKIGDGTDGYRIRLQKNEQNPGKYEPAEMTVQQMMALVKVHDAIEDYDLTFGVLGANCIVNIYEANDENQAVGEPIAFADLTPGRYIAKAVAATGSDYDGETAMSNIFELFEGFEVVVPAGEYATFYKDEPLYADPVTSTDAELYTITSVSGDKAILSNAIETAPSGTPLLVYNKGTEEKTFLLIPANAEPNLALDVYDGFIGTMQPTVIPASNATTDNYAFNGKQFVWVMNEIAIGANKAWLSIPKTNGNPKNIRIYRGNGEATGIDESIVNSEDMNSVWYDLNGRKLQGKPSLKGVYIKNGKKVVVK